jgi:hyperosmotically inducible periplasmic protein
MRNILCKATVPLFALLLLGGCTDRQQDRTGTEAREAGRAAEGAVDNAATTTAVKSKMAADVRLSTIATIDVDSSGNTVTLSGTVPTADDKRKAEEVAKTVDGVTRVVNNLEVRP